MFLNRKKKAFSLVELMMILLVASLITAALFPVITKKHFRLPMLVNHGAYLCYYKEGKLREAKWAGKMKTKELFDRETDNCVFVPPKKAGYFEISAIGGGGGGGDAGYTGGNWISTYTDYIDMTPFDIDEKKLEALYIDKEEFLKYAGFLYGYANSVGSGAGGAIGYTERTESSTCLGYGTKDVDIYENIGATCKATWADGKCTFYKCNTTRKCGTKQETYNCSYTPASTCEEYGPKPEPVVSCKPKYRNEQKLVEPAKDVPGWCYVVNGACPGSCNGGSRPSVDGSGGYGTATCTRHIDAKYESVQVEDGKECTTTQASAECVKWKSYPEVKKTCTREVTDENNCKDTTEYEETGTGIDQAECKASDTTQRVKVGTKTVIDYSNCKEGYKYSYSYDGASQSGNSGGSGASCQSASPIAGNLNLTGKGGKNFSGPGVDGANKDYYDKYAFFCETGEAETGTAACYSEATGAYYDKNCGTNISYSYFEISQNGTQKSYVQADSASSGGGGGKRDWIKDSSKIDNCIDTSSASSITATDGRCAAGVTATKCKGSNYYGYCLAHHYSPSLPEAEGNYAYRYGYDFNYLGYGGKGSPGEFKTTIVRSLKGVDTTIKVGRGGSAAALNSGSNGIDGSKSSFGDIISALGGSGGTGYLAQDAEILEPFDKERYEKESTCYYYDSATAKDKRGNYVYEDSKKVNAKNPNSKTYGEIRKTLREEPAYCSGLINQLGNYKFFKISNQNEAGDYPTPTGIFSSFLNLAFQKLSNGEESPLAKFTRYGRGGKGGAVEHRCWGGRREVEFEKEILKTSVFVDQASAAANGSNKYVPANCRNDYSNIPAGPGADGAVLIKW